MLASLRGTAIYKEKAVELVDHVLFFLSRSSRASGRDAIFIVRSNKLLTECGIYSPQRKIVGKSSRLSDDISSAFIFFPVFLLRLSEFHQFISIIFVTSRDSYFFDASKTALGYHLPRFSSSVTFAIYRWLSKDFIRYLNVYRRSRSVLRRNVFLKINFTVASGQCDRLCVRLLFRDGKMK